MNKKQLIKIIEEIGTLLELKGENPFKARAYYNAARTLETLDRDISGLVESGEISDLKGIGKALADKITTLVTTGDLPYYQDLRSSVPDGLFAILKIPGLGVKKVKVIFEKLAVSNPGELEYACRENRLRDLDGFGQKSQDNILKNIEIQKQYNEFFLYPQAEFDAHQIISYLKNISEIIRIELAGSLRRKKEIIRDIDIVASCTEEFRDKIMGDFINYPELTEIIVPDSTKTTIKATSGINIDLRLVNDDEFAFTLHHSTGSKEHNTAMRSLAKTKNLKMNEYGLFSGDNKIECNDEKEIFKVLDLPFIAPELREDRGEIENAAADTLPDLYNGSPFYGIFHVHTTYSDGAHSIAEMADVCREKGWEYIGITDHSKSAFYANGLSEERIYQQHREIDELNKKYKDFTILKGIESDILPDGKLDYADDVLESFDFVIASVHSSFNLSQEDMTIRICRALEHPSVTMLGHPTGRLLLGREPYPLEMEKVIETAGKHNKIIEINSSPYRLDLDWRFGHLATKAGVKTALNPDAHSIDGITDYTYGIGIAQKAGFTTTDILNSYNTNQITELFQNIKK